MTASRRGSNCSIVTQSSKAWIADVLAQRGRALVDQGDDRRVEIVLDGEHGRPGSGMWGCRVRLSLADGVRQCRQRCKGILYLSARRRIHAPGGSPPRRSTWACRRPVPAAWTRLPCGRGRLGMVVPGAEPWSLVPRARGGSARFGRVSASARCRQVFLSARHGKVLCGVRSKQDAVTAVSGCLDRVFPDCRRDASGQRAPRIAG